MPSKVAAAVAAKNPFDGNNNCCNRQKHHRPAVKLRVNEQARMRAEGMQKWKELGKQAKLEKQMKQENQARIRAKWEAKVKAK